MLAENLADSTSAHEPESILQLPPASKDGSGADGGVAAAAPEPAGVGEGDGLERTVGMEIEGGGDGDFMVEDEAEQVSNRLICAASPMIVEMDG